MSATNPTDQRQLARKNVRTALMLALIALASLAGFVHKIWNLG